MPGSLTAWSGERAAGSQWATTHMTCRQLTGNKDSLFERLNGPKRLWAFSPSVPYRFLRRVRIVGTSKSLRESRVDNGTRREENTKKEPKHTFQVLVTLWPVDHHIGWERSGFPIALLEPADKGDSHARSSVRKG